MLKAMRAQDKKEAQAAQAQDRVSLKYIFLKFNLEKSPQKLDDIDGKVNAVGKSVEKKIDMISTYLIRYFINMPTEECNFLKLLLIFRMNNKIEALAKGGGGGSR